MKRKSHFVRLLEYNTPKINVPLGLFAALIEGSIMPIFGILLAKMLFILEEPVTILIVNQQVRSDSNYYCLLMFTAAILALIFTFTSKFLFGVIGENVTLKIR